MTICTEGERRTFVDEVSKVLRDSAGKVDTRKIVELGRSSRALSVREISALEWTADMPQWLRAELGLTRVFPSSRNFRVETVFTRKKFQCKPPQVFGAASLPAVFEDRSGRSSPVSLITGTNGKFLLQSFLQAAFLEDGYIPMMTHANNLWGWQLLGDRPARRLKGRTLLCVVEGSAIFTHWLLDTMPRLHVVRLCGYELDHFDHVVFATIGSNFCEESFSVLGINRRKVRTRQTLGSLISCDEFCHVTNVREDFFADDWLYAFVNRTFKDVDKPARSWRRLFISRSRSKKRRLLNEAELHPLLEQYRFQIVHAEELGVRGMAQLCAEASHIVAPHGAGLSNLVFASPGTIVLELYGPHLSPEYWRICNQLGHNYFLLQGTGEGGQEFTPSYLESLTKWERNQGHFQIDKTSFSESLKAITSA